MHQETGAFNKYPEQRSELISIYKDFFEITKQEKENHDFEMNNFIVGNYP